MGTDVRLDVKEDSQDTPQVELGRNFANKLWNAGRFLLMKSEAAGAGDAAILAEDERSAADLWILSRYHSAMKTIYTALDNYRLNEYSKAVYDLVWRDFCDWYVEIFKVVFAANEDSGYRKRLSNFGLQIFDGILRLLHPLMPFITEELWQNLVPRSEGEYLCTAQLPALHAENTDSVIELEFALLQEVVEEIRRSRGAANIPPGERIPVMISAGDSTLAEFFTSQSGAIAALARCNPLAGVNLPKPEQALASVVRGVSVYVVRGESFDREKEITRLNKEVERLGRLMRSFSAKLGNPGFLAKAKPEVIQAEQEKLLGVSDALEKVLESLRALNG